MNQSERELQHEIRKALGKAPDLVLWRNNVGASERADGSHIKYGLTRGACDLLGILAPSGRWFCLEVKTLTGRESPHQKLFQDLIRRKGGFACTVRSVEQARAALLRAREGATE